MKKVVWPSPAESHQKNLAILNWQPRPFLGDPHLHYLAWLGDLKIYVVAAALSLVSMPWIASQLDG